MVDFSNRRLFLTCIEDRMRQGTLCSGAGIAEVKISFCMLLGDDDDLSASLTEEGEGSPLKESSNCKGQVATDRAGVDQGSEDDNVPWLRRR